MTVLSTDPGAAAGWAIVDGDKVLESAPIDGTCIDAIHDVVSWAHENCGVDVLVMEAQRPGPMGAKSLERLYWHRHIWELCALNVCMELAKPMPPATWQAHWKLKAEKACWMECGLTLKIADYDMAKDKKNPERKRLARERNLLRSARQRRFQDAIIKMASTVMGRPVAENEADALLQGLCFEARR